MVVGTAVVGTAAVGIAACTPPPIREVAQPDNLLPAKPVYGQADDICFAAVLSSLFFFTW